jgi:hypothetical protein
MDFAKGLNLDSGLLASCLEHGKYKDQIQADVAQAMKIGADGTPTFIVGRSEGDGVFGELIIGALPFEVFDAKLLALGRVLHPHPNGTYKARVSQGTQHSELQVFWSVADTPVVGFFPRTKGGYAPIFDFSMTCEEFRREAVWGQKGANVTANTFTVGSHGVFRPDAKDLSVDGIRHGVTTACDSMSADAVRIAAEEAEKGRKAAELEAKQRAEFREGLLAVVQAANEPDPFASIRGDFDLSAPTSRQWKTTLVLQEAEKCRLLRTQLATGGVTAWTFGCLFPVSSDGYEHMVESVRQVLNLPFQPDEHATNINQVYFSDPSKPDWRLFVGRISEAITGISIVAAHPAGADGAVFLESPTQLPVGTSTGTAATIRGEIEAIERSGKFQRLPPAIAVTSERLAGTGMCERLISNKTPYRIRVMITGAIDRAFELAPNESNSVEIPAGSYKLAARALDDVVTPLLEAQTYVGGTRYSSDLVISSR